MTDGAEATCVKGGVIGAEVWVGIGSQGAVGLGVPHAISSLPSSAGRRVLECGRDPCPQGVWDSPILGQDNLIFKLKGNQTKTRLSLTAQRSLSASSKSGLIWPLTASTLLHAAAILT